MSKMIDKLNVGNFTIEGLDLSEIDKISNFLPKNGVIDLNIAEIGLAMTLEGQNQCQEKLVLVERWIGFREMEKNKAWTSAAIDGAKKSGMKTAKDKEWFAQADSGYISACNNLTLAKAAKKWLENKASYFSGWHYAFKTFLRRDYSLEKIASSREFSYNIDIPNSSVSDDGDDICGDIEWK